MENHEISSDAAEAADANVNSNDAPDTHVSSPVVLVVAVPTTQLPPLDPRILANVVSSYEGGTLRVPHCDVPVYHGRGRLAFRTGFVYSGDLYLGRMHGRGRIEWTSSGVVFEGDFVFNEMRGQGVYTWPNGSSFSGDIVAGKRHGHGVFVTGHLGVPSLSSDGGGGGGEDAGDVELLNTESMEMLPPPQSMDAPLHFTFQHHPQDDTDGDSQANIPAQSNARYDGQWVDGQPHGHGVLVYDDARDVRYEGQFVHGRREGQGSMRYASGNLYVGGWKDDRKCGFGVMRWMGPSFTDHHHHHHQLHEVYEGQWLDDRQHGFGRHVWLHTRQKEKNYYEGEFESGLRHGLGVFFYANGARYEGEWRANVKEGRGTLFYEDGRVFCGVFRDDRCVEGGAAKSMEVAAGTTATAQSGSGGGTSSSSTSAARLLLYIDALLPAGGRDKARKAVENAALRLNTELRALYRHYMKGGNGANAGATVPSDGNQESVFLMETFESRKLLAECGVHINSGHLEQLVEDIRSAQRQSVKVPAIVMKSGLVSTEEDTSSTSCRTKEDTISNSSNDNSAEDLPVLLERLQLKNTLPKDDSSCAVSVVPHDQLLLYREFVELLIRIAHWQRTTAGQQECGEEDTNTHFSLAEAFADLYEQMARARLDLQRVSSSSSESWLGELHNQLHAKETQVVFKKHRVLLYKLFCECGEASGCGGNQSEPTEDDNGEEDATTKCVDPHAVSIRSLLRMLRHVDTTGRIEFFAADFKLRDALRALEQVFSAPSSSQLPAQSEDDSQQQQSANNSKHVQPAVDPFFSDTLLVHSEFLDALAVVLFVKQQQQQQMKTRTSEQLQPTPQGSGAPEQQQEQHQLLPLHVLVDQFLQSVRV